MKKIKIGYMISHLENSGPVNILYGIIKYLDRDKFEPYIITLKNEKSNSREKEFKDMGVIVIKNITSNFNIVFKNDRVLEKKIKELKLKILHAHCLPSTIMLARLRLENIKKISTLHSDFSSDLKYKFGIIRGYIYKKLYINSLNKLDLNISCGKEVSKLNYLHSKIKSISIMNGVDKKIINPKNIIESKIEIRKNLGVDIEKKIFITVSSIDQRKNVLFLAKAFKEKFKEYIFIILGSGNKEKELKEIIKESKNIYYFGKKKLDEIQYYLKASDFYISASHSEGMPTSVLEALQFKLPVILSNIAPHKEINDISSKIGILFKNNNLEDLKEKIEKILEKELNLEGIEFEISADRMSKEYQLEYEKIIIL